MRGTRLTQQGREKRKELHYSRFISGQVTAGSTVLIGGSPAAVTPVTTNTALGKGSNTFAQTGLFITTADVISTTVLDMWDVDLTKKIYLDHYFYMKTGMSAGDSLSTAGTVLAIDPTAGVGSANDFGTDNAAVVACTGANVLTIVAGDIVQIKKSTGMYIPASSWTDNGFYCALTFTFTITTASAAEFAFIGATMRYTDRY